MIQAKISKSEQYTQLKQPAEAPEAIDIPIQAYFNCLYLFLHLLLIEYKVRKPSSSNIVVTPAVKSLFV